MAKFYLADVRRGRWLLISTVLYLILLGIFVLVGFKESSILGFTGLSRVLINFSHAIVIVLPLLALTMTAQAVPKDRQNGTLEALMSHPIRRNHYYGGLLISRCFAMLVPFGLILAAVELIGRFGFGQQIISGYLRMTFASSATLISAFVGLGVFISVPAKNQTRALIYAPIGWRAGVALLDFVLIGLMLQWRLEAKTVFVLAGINPIQSARFVLLTSLETKLNILGPVGFFLVNKLGHAWVEGLGILWPLLFGGLATWFGWESFKRSDII